MQAIFDQDSSFFQVNLPSGNVSQDVISFEITEEIGRMTTGNIQFYDPYFTYMRFLKPNTRFELTWGYKKRNVDAVELQIKQKNPVEITGTGIRKGLKCVTQSPGGAGANNGVITFNCGFYTEDFLANEKFNKVYSFGTKEICVRELFRSLGVNDVTVKFSRQNDVLNSERYIRQTKSSFKFLLELCFEWQCIFKIAFTPAGTITGIFVDNSELGGAIVKSFNEKTTGGFGSNKLIEFGVDAIESKVISYTWQNHAGDQGLGDSSNIEIIDGQPVITQKLAPQIIVQGMVLNEKRLAEFQLEHKDIAVEVMAQVVKSQSLDDVVYGKKVKDFFDPITSQNAPQGYGYTVELEMIGDPLYTPTMEVVWGAGFPDFLLDKTGMNKFYVKKVTHKMDAQGYKMAVSVADAITSFGSYVR